MFLYHFVWLWKFRRGKNAAFELAAIREEPFHFLITL